MENNLIYILNKKEKIINILNNTDGPNKCPFFDDLLSQSLSTGADTYKFSTIFNDKNSATILVGNKVAFMYKGDFLLFQIISVDEIHNENMEIEVYCESAGLSLINNVCRKTDLVSSDIRKFLETVLQDTEWNVGFVDMSITNSIDVEIPTASVYSIIQNNLSRYNAEIRFRCELNNGRISKKFVDVFRERGRFTGKRFEFGKNIEGLTRSVDSSELFTALIGEGKNGLSFKDIELPDVPNKPMGADFVYDQEAFSLYNHNGYHLMGVYKYDTESPEELLRETYKKLQECKKPKITYDVNVSLLDYDVSVGDTVNIIDRFFNPPLFLKARVNKLEESLTDSNVKKCVLSNFIEVKSNINSALLEQIKDFVNNTVTDRFPIGTDDIQDGAINGDKIYESSITTDHLIAGSVTADKIQANSIRADHIAANEIKSNHIEAGAIDATKIQAESIESEHIVANAIKSEHIDTGSITTDKIEAGSITAEKIQTGAITAGSGIIAEGAIGSAQISSLEANKINTGTIDTSLVNIAGPDGNMEITGNQLLVNNKGKNRVIVGEYRTDEEGETKYGLLVRGEDDTTIMIDERGVHNAGITDGAIDNNKVSQNANIDGTKLNINSVIREVNENGTESIKGTKVVVGDRSLEVELKEQQNTITEHGRELSTQKSQIIAMDNKINLKVDNQTFTEATQTINQSIGSAIETSKAYTNAEISTVDKKLEKNTSEIKILKDEISTKVSQVDIDKTIQNIQIGGRNLLTENILNKFYGSAVKSGNEWTLSSNGEVSYFQNDNVLLNQEKGSEFTFSASIKCLSESISKKVRITVWHDGNWDDYYIQDELTNEYKRFSKTVKLKNNSKIGLCIQIDGVNRADDRIMFKELKLERGNKATDWSPAPEDVDKAIVDKVGVVSEKISSVESKLTQDLDGIKLNVSGLDSKTTQLETNITTVNRDLTGKINSGVQSAKDYATNQANSAKQQAISTSAQDATNKANQAQQNAINSSKEYTNVQISSTNSKVSEVQSSLNVLKEKVETKVSQSDVDKSISNIQIGDRNYLTNSMINKTNSDYLIAQLYFGKEKPKESEEFTISIKGELGEGKRLFGVYNSGGNVSLVSLDKRDSNGIYRGTFNWIVAGTNNTHINIYTIDSSTVVDSTIEWVKLEKGNKVSSSWTPAPEDTDSKIQDGIRVTDEKINKVSSTVTQLKDSVTTEISSLKSKTQTIESNLDGKASKSEVQELNTQVAQQKVSLDGITNRVGQTETKTSQLEGSINEVNLDLTGKINSGVQNAKDFATNQVNQAKDEIIDIASQDATSKANQAQENAINGANSYTDAQVNITNNKVSSVESSLNILKDKVETKVSQSYVDESLIEVNNTIKANKKEISSISSSVTQLRDSINTQISSLTSKTQLLESNLDGKATKQEVSEVNNRVTSIDANLQGITQRVTNTESKTQSLESNLNGKASKQEVQNVKEQVASVEVNLNGITNRVQSTESNINKLDGKLQNTVTKSEFTEFKQNTDSFKLTIEQRSTMNNLVPNSSFEGYGRAWTCNGEFWSGPYVGYDFKGRFCGAIKNSSRYNNEKYLMSEKCFRVKKNTTYTLNFKFALEQNVDSMDAFVILSDSESTNYGQAIHMYNASGGSQTNNWQEQCVSKTFNTGNYEWVWLRFDHNGMKQNVNVNEWCWLYISEVGVYEGEVGQVKWTPSGGESYSSSFLLDRNGLKANFDDGSYAYMGRDGFEWYNSGTGHSYHALTYVTSFDIPAGNPGRAYVKLPIEFTKKKNSLRWTVATRGYYYNTTGSFFPYHVHCSGSAPAYEENGQLVCSVEGVCKIQNSNNSNDIQYRPLTAMLIAIA